jgi:hypothetical protein
MPVELRPGRAETWAPPPLAIDPDIVLRLAGYRNPATVSPAIRAAARRMAERAAALVAPRARLRLVTVAAGTPDHVALAEGVTLSGGVVARLLAGCERAVACVLTLGPALEAEVLALADRDEPLDAYLLDVAGWAGTQAAGRALRAALRARWPGAEVTHRLGPGHADWPIEEQRVLVELLEPTEGVVTLTEQCLLVPFKSVSGIYGLRDRAAPVA